TNGISTINLSLNDEAEPNLTSLQSLDLKLDFDETNFNFISANFEAGLIGSVNDQDGILSLAAISLNPITDFSNLSTVSTTNAVISDVLINEISYRGGSYLIDLTSDTYSGFVVSRDGSAMLDVLIETTSGNSTRSGLDGSFSIETSGGGDLINGSFNIDPSLNIFSSADALDALRLAVGMHTQNGTKNATDYIAADFNQDGKVTSSDALAILKHAVGLSVGAEPKWVFVDSNGDYSDINQSSVVYQDGVIVPLSSGSTAISLTGILIGDVNDTYSGLIL
ncbi:MAG: dockerin type I domain-containing protein, partial [Pseudomonadales bacterium]